MKKQRLFYGFLFHSILLCVILKLPQKIIGRLIIIVCSNLQFICVHLTILNELGLCIADIAKIVIFSATRSLPPVSLFVGFCFSFCFLYFAISSVRNLPCELFWYKLNTCPTHFIRSDSKEVNICTKRLQFQAAYTIEDDLEVLKSIGAM